MSEHQGGREAAAEAPSPRLTFDLWMDLSARLLGLEQEARLDLLDDEGIDVGEWMKCDRHYSLALADDIAHGRMERAERYGKRCAAEMERRGKAAEPAAPGNGAAAQVAAAGAEESAGMKIGAPLEAGPAVVPTFLHAQPPSPGPASPAQELVTTAAAFEIPSALRAGVLPFSKTAAPTLPAPSTERLQAPPAESPGGTQILGSTAPLDPAIVRKAALPFAGPPPAKPPTHQRMPLPMYASFYAELSTFPDRVAEIRQRYGVASDEAHAALDEEWRKRLDTYPDIRVEWQALVAKHRDSLLRPRG